MIKTRKVISSFECETEKILRNLLEMRSQDRFVARESEKRNIFKTRIFFFAFLHLPRRENHRNKE